MKKTQFLKSSLLIVLLVSLNSKTAISSGGQPADTAQDLLKSRIRNGSMLAGDEVPWGEPLNGLRMRVIAQSGTEYVRMQSLPLAIEIQNISITGFPIHRLPVGVRAEATDESGKTLDLIEPVTISPWHGRPGDLSAGSTVQLTLWFSSFKFVNPPKAGSVIKLCFVLPTRDQISVPSDGTARLFLVKSNTIQITLKDIPPFRLGAGNVPEKWYAFMDFVYREDYSKPGIYKTVHINRDGYTTIVSSNAGLPSTRMEVVLDSEVLDKLAKLLRDNKVWELATVESQIAGQDEGNLSFTMNSAGSSLTRMYRQAVLDNEPFLKALQGEMQALITTAATLWEEDQKGWGEETEGLQSKLQADRIIWKYGEIPTFKASVRNHGMRELFIANYQRGCELQFDGRWYYFWTGSNSASILYGAFEPGRQYNDTPISLVENWRSKEGNKPININPGKHTIRVAFDTIPFDKNKNHVRLVSNPVEIEILPEE
jgi:hypothetical protein